MSEKQWYVAQNGQSIGPMTEEQLKAGLANGTYAGTDHVFTEGMKGWVPASSVPELVGAAPAVPPPRHTEEEAPTRSTTRSSDTKCSSSRSNSTPEKASSPRPAA